jgi:hypothetical protein
VVRLGLIPLVLFAAACTGDIQADNLEGLDPEEQIAQQKWVEEALPVLTANCLMCHDGSMPMIGYIAGATDLDKRETLVNYMPAVVNLAAPSSSRMLTKGAHTGPALEATQTTSILNWIKAEAKARPEVPPVRTDKMVAQACTAGNPGDPTCPINTVDLTPLGVPGTLEYVATSLVSDAYLTNIKVKAGAMGLYISHPIFETWPMDMVKPDPIDRWFNVVINIAPNAEAVIGTGEGTYTAWKITDALSFRVDVIGPQKM